MYFSKKVYAMYNAMESEAKPQKVGNFREFCVKSNLRVCKVTFN